MPDIRDYDSRYREYDEAIVQCLLVGATLPGGEKAGFGDRLEAIRRMAGRGLSDSQVGKMLGMSGRQVLRWRTRWGIAGLPVGTNGATRPVQPQVWLRAAGGGTTRKSV